MRQRLVSLGLIFGLLGVGGLGVNARIETVQAQQLEARWNQDVAQGVPDASLVPLRAALVAQQGSLVNWEPWQANSVIEALKRQTTRVESLALANSRQRALAAKAELARALGTSSRLQLQAWRDDLEGAHTPLDYDSLAAEWHLETLVVPIDRQVAERLGNLNTLAAKARGLGVSDVPAADVNTSVNTYLDMGARLRGRLAERFLVRIQLADQALQERVSAAQAAHDVLAGAAAAIAKASSAGLNVSARQAELAQAQAAYTKALTPDEFNAVSASAQSIINTVTVQLAAMPRGDYSPAVSGGTYIISGVPQYYQLPLSCEETATSMALVHQGLHVSTQQILNGLGVDNTPIQFSGGLISRWGDPDQAFVGNVYGSENHAPYGYQANPKALVRVINSYGGRIIEWSEPGIGPNSISAAEIYRQVQAGHPVVAYATWDWRYHTIHYYTDEYGDHIANIYPYDDHVYVVYGVSASSVLVHDPIRGTYWVSKAAFSGAYEFGMAIVLA